MDLNTDNESLIRLLIKKVFGTLSDTEQTELSAYLNHRSDREFWEKMDKDTLLDLIKKETKDWQTIDLDSAKNHLRKWLKAESGDHV